ncbi:MAG: PepSY-associated TM helix domain-containing protein [Bacteroidota bacterium]
MAEKKSSKNSKLQKKLWAIHSWLGLYSGVVIAVLSLSGVLALYKFDIDHALNYSKFYTEPKGERIEIGPVIDSLNQKYGAENLATIAVPSTPEKTWQISYYIRDGLSLKAPEVFVEPYTGEILGTRDYQHSFAYFIRNIHVRLYESLFGRQIVGLAGLALLISTITGFWIYGNFMKRQFFAAIRKKNLRVQTADFHKLIGIATLAFNLMIAITGTWLGLQAWLQPVVMGDRPGFYKPEEKPLTKEEDLQMPFDVDQAIKRTNEIFPEMIVHFVSPSRNGSRSLRVAGNVPGQVYERFSFSVTLDKEDLSLIQKYDIREASMGEKVFFVQEAFHFGDFGGVITKILYSLFGLTSGFLALSGFVMYLKRTEVKRSRKPTFIELKPLLVRWSLGIFGVCALLAFLQLSFGVVIPAILVVVCVYGALLFLVGRYLFIFAKQRITNLRTA